MANQDDGFLREVEEEIRRERYEKIWREYGTFILIGAGLIVFGVLAYKYIENQRIEAAQTTGARYEEALGMVAAGKEGSAAAEFETIVKDGSGGYPALSRLQLAGALLKEDKKQEALAAYEALAADTSADKMLRDFAALQAASVQMGSAGFTEMENRLTPLMSDDNPWRFSARELLGVAAFQAGKPGSEVRTILAPLLVDQETPKTITDRVQIVLAQIASAELAKKADAAPEPEPAATPDATKAEGTSPDATPPAAAADAEKADDTSSDAKSPAAKKE
jgi:hypothetical protein